MLIADGGQTAIGNLRDQVKALRSGEAFKPADGKRKSYKRRGSDKGRRVGRKK